MKTIYFDPRENKIKIKKYFYYFCVRGNKLNMVVYRSNKLSVYEPTLM